MKRTLVLFQSTHGAILAERACLDAGVSCKVIAVPREISSECGVALEIRDGQQAAVADLLAAKQIVFSIVALE